jgi:hypothetical protein
MSLGKYLHNLSIRHLRCSCCFVVNSFYSVRVTHPTAILAEVINSEHLCIVFNYGKE